ncbi:MAG: hypothetical protein ACRES5_10460 [Pseudomonas sp.]
MGDKAQEEAHLDLAEQYIAEMTRRVREQKERIEMLLVEGQSTKQASDFLEFSLEILKDTQQCRAKFLSNLNRR